MFDDADDEIGGRDDRHAFEAGLASLLTAGTLAVMLAVGFAVATVLWWSNSFRLTLLDIHLLMAVAGGFMLVILALAATSFFIGLGGWRKAARAKVPKAVPVLGTLLSAGVFAGFVVYAIILGAIFVRFHLDRTG